jgi:hypothetical protein
LRRRSRGVARFTALYLALAAAFALLTMRQAGALQYYLMETTTLCSLLAPLGLELLNERLLAETGETRMAVALLLVGCPVIGAIGWSAATTTEVPDWGRFAAVLSHHRVLSDQPYLAVQGTQPELVDTYVMSLLEQTGQWSPASIVQQIAQQQFDFIALKLQRAPHGQRILWPPHRTVPILSPKIVAATLQHYRAAGTCGQGAVRIFVPRQQPRGDDLARQAAAACATR